MEFSWMSWSDVSHRYLPYCRSDSSDARVCVCACVCFCVHVCVGGLPDRSGQQQAEAGERVSSQPTTGPLVRSDAAA